MVVGSVAFVSFVMFTEDIRYSPLLTGPDSMRAFSSMECPLYIINQLREDFC